MYTDKEFQFIDKLLNDSLNNNYTYEKLSESKSFDYDLYTKLFSDINKNPLNLINIKGDVFDITNLGRKVATSGFKNYLESIKLDQDSIKETQELDKIIKTLTLDDLKKSDSRSRNALILSISAIIISVVFGILNYTKSEKSNNDINNNTKSGQIQGDSTSKINHPEFKGDSVSKTSIKIISDSSKH
jgi:hypothetical protein